MALLTSVAVTRCEDSGASMDFMEVADFEILILQLSLFILTSVCRDSTEVDFFSTSLLYPDSELSMTLLPMFVLNK